MRGHRQLLTETWLFTYAKQLVLRRFGNPFDQIKQGKIHILLAVANHFEPGWRGVNIKTGGLDRINNWVRGVESMSDITDGYGSVLKHTYFFPIEQYEQAYLDDLVEHCRRGYGEVEVHLHHGIDQPDTSENLRNNLQRFLNALHKVHGWVVRDRYGRSPCYAFVHGNWALGNSWGGRFCGVDNEIDILAKTGCYVDMTLPSAPHPTQVGVINSIYTPAFPLNQPVPHRRGVPLQVGSQLPHPLFFLIQGPLLFNWKRRILGMPFPRLENGELSADYLPSVGRFCVWASTNIHVLGRPEWIFIKLHCHGLQERHTKYLAGESMRRFLGELLSYARNHPRLQLHFVTAREMANIALAAVEGADGDPNDVKDLYWKLE